MYSELIEYLQQGLSVLEGTKSQSKASINPKSSTLFPLSPATDNFHVKVQREKWGSKYFSSRRRDSSISQRPRMKITDITPLSCVSISWQVKLTGLQRVKDVYSWYGSCHSCVNLKAHKPIRARMQTIQTFEPMAMVGLDSVGPIIPRLYRYRE